MATRRDAFRMGLCLAGALPPVLAAAPAAAGRDPTAEERTRIEAALRALGYQSWDEIEVEDGHIEVDDARMADGREHDLKLNPQSLAVLEREED